MTTTRKTQESFRQILKERNAPRLHIVATVRLKYKNAFEYDFEFYARAGVQGVKQSKGRQK